MNKLPLDQVDIWRPHFWWSCKCLKNPSRFFARVQIGQKFIFLRAFFFESTIKMLAIISIRFRYLVDCIHCEIFFWKKCNSENMAKNVAAKFPPDLELQYMGPIYQEGYSHKTGNFFSKFEGSVLNNYQLKRTKSLFVCLSPGLCHPGKLCLVPHLT